MFVSWAKPRQLGSDLTLSKVIRIGYFHGVAESTALGNNTIGSALEFTRPQPGKVYAHSDGKLPGAA